MRGPWHWSRRPLSLPTAPIAEEAGATPTLVHIVRAANGPQALRHFAQALRRHDPGIDYRLVLAMKGFTSSAEVRTHLAEAADLAPHTLFFPDVGFDVGVFLAAAAQLRHGRYCFMNSWARPLRDGWLAKLSSALGEPDVGMVGPTGSWGSMRSWLTYSLGLPSGYRGVLPPPREGRRQLAETELALRPEVPDVSPGVLRRRLRLLQQAPELLLGFPSFPSAHLRTPIFMITHAVLRRVELFEISNNRIDTWALESGSESLTRQVQRMGLRVLVVDAEGTSYEPGEWPASNTYRQGDQQGLLVGDRRTLEYHRGDLAQRRLMARFCWGEQAAPQRPLQPSAS